MFCSALVSLFFYLGVFSELKIISLQNLKFILRELIILSNCIQQGNFIP